MLLLCGCALRPRYQDFSKQFVGGEVARSEVLLQVVDGNEGKPVPGARVEMGERYRFKTSTDENGLFHFPVDAKFAEENALVVITLPKGVKGYRIVGVAPAASGGAPPSLESPDAGVTTL